MADEESVVSMSLAKPVLIAERPVVEVYPPALLLHQNHANVTSAQSTLFCFIKNTDFVEHYTFTWLRRATNEDKEKNRPLEEGKDVERLEAMDLPVGILLRLDRIQHDAIYTCQVRIGNMLSEVEVRYYFTFHTVN